MGGEMDAGVGSARRRRYEEVTIPVPDVLYQAATKFDGFRFTQKIALAFDETGARNVAETIIVTGVPAFDEPPTTAHLGEAGPLITG
ncbi:hypothetical protein [Corynebacterium capitovis]|uniref:hypothetical protein n=1 Tax=Corynebacterium capitovis TaxID=131081 RepID=UPI0012EABE64|nr:hypothetical protein [Corynebacterium capitovis]